MQSRIRPLKVARCLSSRIVRCESSSLDFPSGDIPLRYSDSVHGNLRGHYAPERGRRRPQQARSWARWRFRGSRQQQRQWRRQRPCRRRQRRLVFWKRQQRLRRHWAASWRKRLWRRRPRRRREWRRWEFWRHFLGRPLRREKTPPQSSWMRSCGRCGSPTSDQLLILGHSTH